MTEPTKFTKSFGIEVHRGDGEVEARLTLGPQHLNSRGVAHGGVVAALLDTALGDAVVAAIPKAWWCATISLSVQFIAGARRGELIARGRCLRHGRSTAFASGEARDASGRLVATAQGSWHLWPDHPDRLAKSAEASGGTS